MAICHCRGTIGLHQGGGSKTLWVYLKEGIDLSDESHPNFYPIKAEFLNSDSVIIKYENKYYSNGWAAAYQVEDIDLPRKDKLFVPDAIQKYQQ